MKIIAKPSSIPDVLIIEPQIFHDERGWFFESFNKKNFFDAIGGHVNFVQDNHVYSKKGVLRGLHYQMQQPQGKLIRVCRGSIFDVAVDLRQSSKTFGMHVGLEISDKNNKHLWIPPGFAHGYLVLSDDAECLYKVTNYWHADSEKCIAWNDPTLNIQWPKINMPIITGLKDQLGLPWSQAPKFNC